MNIILFFIIADLIYSGVAAILESSEIPLLKTTGVKRQSQKAILKTESLRRGLAVSL